MTHNQKELLDLDLIHQKMNSVKSHQGRKNLLNLSFTVCQDESIIKSELNP